jgi:hypothetical protein
VMKIDRPLAGRSDVTGIFICAVLAGLEPCHESFASFRRHEKEDLWYFGPPKYGSFTKEKYDCYN